MIVIIIIIIMIMTTGEKVSHRACEDMTRLMIMVMLSSNDNIYDNYDDDDHYDHDDHDEDITGEANPSGRIDSKHVETESRQ